MRARYSCHSSCSPQSTLNCSLTRSNLSGTATYEPYVAGQEESECVCIIITTKIKKGVNQINRINSQVNATRSSLVTDTDKKFSFLLIFKNTGKKKKKKKNTIQDLVQLWRRSNSIFTKEIRHLKLTEKQINTKWHLLKNGQTTFLG